MGKRSLTVQDAFDPKPRGVPLRLGGTIVGKIEFIPNLMRGRLLQERLREAEGKTGKRETPGLGGVVPASDAMIEANNSACVAVLHVMDILSNTRWADDLLENLAADTFLDTREMSPKHVRYLAEAGLHLLDMPALRVWIRQKLDAQQTEAVRDLLAMLTPGRAGRKPRINPEARRIYAEFTALALESHIRPLQQSRNPRHYYNGKLGGTEIGKRLAAAKLLSRFFPSRRPKALGRVTARQIAAELLAAEGWGGAVAIRKDMSSKAPFNLQLADATVTRQGDSIEVSVPRPSRT